MGVPAAGGEACPLHEDTQHLWSRQRPAKELLQPQLPHRKVGSTVNSRWPWGPSVSILRQHFIAAVPSSSASW